MAGYKDYVLEFKLGDGTMHSISFRIPLGENGGYYTPVINQISETEIKISYVPSMADMPTIKPAVIKIPGSGGNVDLTGYATEQFVRDGYQPKGDYLESSALPTAINTALAQAKASGEFDGADGKDGYTPVKGVDYFDGNPGNDGVNGKDGQRGAGILKVSTAPTSYTTATGGKNPIKRMALSTIKSQAGVSEVVIGDQILHGSYLYHTYYLDETYAYMDGYTYIKGANGSAGKDGYTPVKGVDYYTDTDKAEMVNAVIAALPAAEGVGF